MRNFFLCILVLVLDAAFAACGSGNLTPAMFPQVFSGVPGSIWAGITGIVFLVALTFGISLFAFGKTGRAQ